MRSALVCFAALAAVAMATVEEKSADPYVVVTKDVSAGEIVIGTPITVTVAASNIGQLPAHNVNLVDTHPQNEVIPTKSVDKLNGGENITFSYTFTPTELGPSIIATAECTYSPNADEEATAKSISNFVREELDLYRGEADTTPSVRGTVMVLTQDQYDRIHSKRILEIVSYIILAAVPIAVPYVLFKSKLAQIDSLFREAKKKL